MEIQGAAIKRKEGDTMRHKGEWLFGAAGAYLLAIMPQRKRRARKLKGIFYAHRGLHDPEKGVPENSMAAFAAAVEKGYGIELDVQLTKDRIPVVFHDFSLKRVCSAEGRVKDYTFEELQQFAIAGTKQRIPRFADVLRLVDGAVPLLVELKCPDLGCDVCRYADQELQKYNGSYTIESFSPLALLWYRLHRPEVLRGQLAMNYQRQEGHYGLERVASRHLLYNFFSKPDFIAYDIRDRRALSKTICRNLFHCPCAAWTVRSAAQLKQVQPYYDCFIFEGFCP